MNASLLFALALVALSSAASLYGGYNEKNILVNDRGTKIVVFNDDGKAVQIETDKIEVNGDRIVQVQVTGPNRVTKTIQTIDEIVDVDGTTQSDVLAQVFKMHEGTTPEMEFQNLLNTIAQQVQAGRIDKDVLVALQVLSEDNDNIQDQTTLNQILEEDEEIQDLAQKQAWKDTEYDEAQQDAFLKQKLQEEVQLGRTQFGADPLAALVLKKQDFKNAQKVLWQEKLKRASTGKKTVLVSDDGNKIVVINENGKAIKIQTDKVGLRANRVIQVQVTAPQKATKTAYINDKIATQEGIPQSAVLAKTFSIFEGTLNEFEFKELLNTIISQVSTGRIDPTVLVGLQIIDNDFVAATKKLRQLLQEEEFKKLADEELLKDIVFGQTQQRFSQQIPLSGFEQQAVVDQEIRQKAIDQVVSQQQKQQKVGQLLEQVNAIDDVNTPYKRQAGIYQNTIFNNPWQSQSLLDKTLRKQVIDQGIDQEILGNTLYGGVTRDYQLARMLGQDTIFGRQGQWGLRQQQLYGRYTPGFQGRWNVNRGTFYGPQRWWTMGTTGTQNLYRTGLYGNNQYGWTLRNQLAIGNRFF